MPMTDPHPPRGGCTMGWSGLPYCIDCRASLAMTGNNRHREDWRSQDMAISLVCMHRDCFGASPLAMTGNTVIA